MRVLSPWVFDPTALPLLRFYLIRSWTTTRVVVHLRQTYTLDSLFESIQVGSKLLAFFPVAVERHALCQFFVASIQLCCFLESVLVIVQDDCCVEAKGHAALSTDPLCL